MGLPRRYQQPAWNRTCRYAYHRLTRMQGSSEAIARGLAAGVLSGWFPWFGFQIIVAVAIATLLRGNRLAAAAATWVSNPFTYVPIFAFNFRVGSWLLGNRFPEVRISNITTWEAVADLGADLMLPLLLGCVVVGTGMSLLTYICSLRLINKARYRRQLRRLVRRNKLIRPRE
ncbi:MAG: DUF2062 domain-containing protein [Kaiparowitsia implicata GSE-PSE-MK54-09C]|jgi:uncharacterized protein (DUF2062 family)|nr:DUF2062 domain-containing protein [Kaiparowitsia implicata GSE-PSE-MK54-09C]